MTAPRQSGPYERPREPQSLGGSMLALAAVLDLLAEVFTGPASDARGRASVLLSDPSFALPPLAALARPLRDLTDAGTGDIEIEYVRLFLHGQGATAHPYESFYRTGQLMDAECLGGLDALYAAAGVQPRKDSVLPDHLGVELEFLALLLRGVLTSHAHGEANLGVRRIARKLLEDHLLPFSGTFRSRLGELRPAPYFSAAADALGHALAAADAMLTVYHGARDAR
jgi:TorA maturation chaperone TorD